MSDDEKPKDKLWRVRFKMSRTIEIRGAQTGAEAEERARDQVLFKDELPVDRDDIDEIDVSWVDEEVDHEHLPGCLGNHCGHYGCCDGSDINEDAESYHEYCYNCDPEQD